MKEKLSKNFTRLKKSLKEAPNKKTHLDFVAALLTIPVLLSVIILNYNNLNNLNKKPAPSSTPSPTSQVIIVSPSIAPQNNNPTPQTSCKKQIGPVVITYPTEGQTVNDNPVCVNISYSDPSFCSVVWSYRINGGTWSDYNSNNPCLYNMSNGNVKFELRVQSTVSQTQTQTFTRNFVYSGGTTNPTPTPASSSATTQ